MRSSTTPSRVRDTEFNPGLLLQQFDDRLGVKIAPATGSSVDVLPLGQVEVVEIQSTFLRHFDGQLQVLQRQVNGKARSEVPPQEEFREGMLHPPGPAAALRDDLGQCLEINAGPD